MDHSPITAWLRRKAAGDAALNFVSGMFILSGGLMVIAVSYGVAFVLVWAVSQLGVTTMCALLFNARVELPTAVPLAGAALVVVALFAGNARLRREDSRRPARRHISGGRERHSPESLVHLLAYPGASSRLSSDLLFAGPRLMTIGWDHVRKAERLWRLDVGACSRLLGLLAARPAKVPIAELGRAAGISDVNQILPQLLDIRGVVVLENEPPGLSLTRELRRELQELIGDVQPAGSDDEQPVAGPGATGLHELLGVSQTANLEEFETAYRKWIRTTARTGSADARQESDQKTEAVKGAYEAFLRKRGPGKSKVPALKVERVWEKYKQTGS